MEATAPAVRSRLYFGSCTLEWLETAYGEHSGYLTAVARDFGFEDMHSDPRFKAFLKKMGLESEHDWTEGA